MNSNIDNLTINAIRILSVEMIDKAKSGHPGLPLDAAPMTYTLFQNHLNFSIDDKNWDNRDRFVLSSGHGSAMLYSLLHLYGYDLTMDDLKGFRQLGTKTPGHPEYGHTEGVEVTTGPLGQGIANAVGMALAEAHLAATYNRPGYDVVDHYTYALCGEGCLEEGISYEACSLAGTLKLGKLILFYDCNHISIEGNTDDAFGDDVEARFESQGWHVQHVDLLSHPDDVDLLSAAIENAKAEKGKPSLIICHTLIGYGSPMAGTAKVHGAPLGEENIRLTKETLGYDYPPFTCPQEVYDHCHEAIDRGNKAHEEWLKLFEAYQNEYPELAAQYKAVMADEMPDIMKIAHEIKFDKPMATRQVGSIVLNHYAQYIPQLVSGSADLAPSTLTNLKDTPETTYGYISDENYAGRNVHFGIREHAMAAACNGMARHGGIRPLCSTFFVFSDYCKHSIRLSAIMNIPVLYVFTHDSIGVGEDGETHEPVEQLISLRSIPNMTVFRPCDGNETVAAYAYAFSHKGPQAVTLTRQALPQQENSSIEKAMLGGYVLEDSEGTPDVILIATGSEVDLCVQAKKRLEASGIKTRVVSMPSVEVYEKQSDGYKESVLPHSVTARVCVEAGSPQSWYRYAGLNGEVIAMTTFGTSGPAKELFDLFGFTVDNVVEKATAVYSKNR